MKANAPKAIDADIDVLFRDWTGADEKGRKEIEEWALDGLNGRQHRDFEVKLSAWREQNSNAVGASAPARAASPRELAKEAREKAAKGEEVTPAAQGEAMDAPSALLPMAGASPRVSAVAPGLVGEIADYIMASAMFPSRKFAAATALGVVGTLISRRVAGPSGPRGTGTHLYQALIGPTGSGKEHIRSAGKLLLSEAKGEKLIGPGRFKSGAGIVRFLADRPTALCFMDELGRVDELDEA